MTATVLLAHRQGQISSAQMRSAMGHTVEEYASHTHERLELLPGPGRHALLLGTDAMLREQEAQGYTCGRAVVATGT